MHNIKPKPTQNCYCGQQHGLVRIIIHLDMEKEHALNNRSIMPLFSLWCLPCALLPTASTKTFCAPLLTKARFLKDPQSLSMLSLLTWVYFCLPCAMTDIAIGCLSFPNLIILSSSTYCGSPYGPDSLPPTLAPQPMRLLRRSNISISQGLKKFRGLQSLTARLRHQDTLFFRLFWGKSLKVWYLQKSKDKAGLGLCGQFFTSAHSWQCFPLLNVFGIWYFFLSHML